MTTIFFICLVASIIACLFVDKELKLFLLAPIGVFSLLFLWMCFVIVPPGYVYVPVLFGNVRDFNYTNGIHFTNPWNSFVAFDTRHQSLKEEKVEVPSQDQLTTKFDFSLQWRIKEEETNSILRNTGGSLEEVVEKLIHPKFRSLIREQGKTVKHAEEFFTEATQIRLQNNILNELKNYLEPLGVEVEAVLIRDIDLAEVLQQAVQAKKQREIEVETQKAELDRFRIAQQQQIEKAQAELEAAKKDAEKQRTLADARAYEILKLTQAMAKEPSYIQLQALETLKSMAKDPATKFYFMNGNNPLPLLHLEGK